jgi:hypothetical protein
LVAAGTPLWAAILVGLVAWIAIVVTVGAFLILFSE